MWSKNSLISLTWVSALMLVWALMGLMALALFAGSLQKPYSVTVEKIDGQDIVIVRSSNGSIFAIKVVDPKPDGE